MGGLLGGGAKGYVGPPSQIIGGAWPPLAPPLPTPTPCTIYESWRMYKNRKASTDSFLDDEAEDLEQISNISLLRNRENTDRLDASSYGLILFSIPRVNFAMAI